MTRIITKKMYCKNCKKSYEVKVLASTNSMMIQNDPELKRRAQNGTLFKNYCPVCKTELVGVKDE